MTRRRAELALAGAFALVLVVADATSLSLFAALGGSTLGLALLYAVARPSLVRRAAAWAAPRWRRVAPAALLAVALFAATGYAGDQLRHPVVDAATLATDWTTTNGALASVMADYLRWFDAAEADRPALLRDMRVATRQFAGDVDLLERVRPPEAELRTHLAVAALYVRMVDLLGGLPDALAHDDTTTAAAIVREVSTLTDEAADDVRLATPPKP